MDISELKKMLKHSTAVLIMDNGDPSIVVVNYETYKNLIKESGDQGPVPVTPASSSGHLAQAGELELLERINKDILALKEQIEEEEKALAE